MINICEKEIKSEQDACDSQEVNVNCEQTSSTNKNAQVFNERKHYIADSCKQPIPWAVTAVASPIDWFAIPNLGFPQHRSEVSNEERSTMSNANQSENVIAKINTIAKNATMSAYSSQSLEKSHEEEQQERNTTRLLRVWRNSPLKTFADMNRAKSVMKENKSSNSIDREWSTKQWISAGEEHWHERCIKVPLLASASPFTVHRLREECRGWCIPSSLRPVLWLTLTGVAHKVDENEYFCRSLLRQYGYVQGNYALAIETDLERTFPHHPYFSSNDVGLYKLKNVLHALCWRNPLQNYCQAFNFLAAFLLLIFDDEERVFWLMLHVLEYLLPNDFYNETLTGAKVDEEVMKVLLHEALPRVAAHFDNIEFDIGMLFPAWVLTLFVNTLPVNTTLYVWDYILLEGYHPLEQTSAHFEIVLAILYMAQDEIILKSNDAHELVVQLRHFASHLEDARQLLYVARQHRVSTEHVHKLRRKLKPKIVEEIQNLNEQRNVRYEERVARELRILQSRHHEQQEQHRELQECTKETESFSSSLPSNNGNNDLLSMGSKFDDIVSISDQGNHSCYAQEGVRAGGDEWEMMESATMESEHSSEIETAKEHEEYTIEKEELEHQV